MIGSVVQIGLFGTPEPKKADEPSGDKVGKVTKLAEMEKEESEPKFEQKWSKKLAYISLSGMQKGIRRGWTDAALEMATIVIEHFGTERLWRRLHTVMYEDIGTGSMDLSIEVLDRLSKKNTSKSEVLKVVKDLAEAPSKSRECDDATWATEMSQEFREACRTHHLLVDESEFDLIDELEVLRKADINKFWQRVCDDAAAAGNAKAALQVKSSYATRATSEYQGYTFAMFLGMPKRDPIRVRHVDLTGGSRVLTIEEKQVPTCAVDWHNQTGKLALAAASKRLGMSSDALWEILWLEEASIVSPVAVFPNDYKKMRAVRQNVFEGEKIDLATFMATDMRKRYTDLLDDFDGTRRWAVNRD